MVIEVVINGVFPPFLNTQLPSPYPIVPTICIIHLQFSFYMRSAPHNLCQILD
jgi:hypothetical protein